MREKLFINEKFISLESYFESIPELFGSLGEKIYEGRNIVRVVEKDGVRFVIKYFKKITLVNKFVYAHIRKSKAQRSYENSAVLASNGITTPEPVAWINCYKNTILDRSFYISLFTDYAPLEEALKQPAHEVRDILKGFAQFSYKLHKKGIFHLDYNVTNVLFSLNNGVLDFSLIDNNRMKFSSYTYKRGIKNMRRVTLEAPHLGVVAEEYAKEVAMPNIIVISNLIAARAKFLKKHLFKKELKQKIKRLFS